MRGENIMELIEHLYCHYSERLPRIEESEEEEVALKNFEKTLTEEQTHLYNKLFMAQSERLWKENGRYFRLGFTECLNLILDATKREKRRY